MDKFIVSDKHELDVRISLDTHNCHKLQKTTPLSAEKLKDLAKCANHVPEMYKEFYKALKDENKDYGKQAAPVPSVRISNEEQIPRSQLKDFEIKLLEIPNITWIRKKSWSAIEQHLKDIGTKAEDLIDAQVTKVDEKKVKLWEVVNKLKSKKDELEVANNQLREGLMVQAEAMNPFTWANIGPTQRITN